MSTLRVAAINNPSASSGGLAISASGNVTGAGLDLITTQSFSAVSSVSVNNCFSATYDNYVIVFRLAANPTSGTTVSLRLRASGSDNSANSYVLRGRYDGVSSGNLNTTSTSWALSTTNGEWWHGRFDLGSPFAASDTTGVGQLSSGDSQYSNIYALQHDVASAFDGFTLFCSSGAIGGTVSVYGYKK